jgi:hypothetical protein
MPAAVTVLPLGQVIELKSVRVPAPAMAMWWCCLLGWCAARGAGTGGGQRADEIITASACSGHGIDTAARQRTDVKAINADEWIVSPYPHGGG